MAKAPKKVVSELEVGDHIDFHYQKSPHYRAIHVDGAHGGITGRAFIQFTLFNERSTIPRRTEREIKKVKGPGSMELGSEVVVDSLGGVMRHLEVTAYMDINTAREFLVWFNDKVRDLERMAGFPEDQWVSFKKKEAADTDGQAGGDDG